MHARVEFRRRNLVAGPQVRVVARRQIAERRVVAQVRGVRVHQQVVAALRLVEVAHRGRAVVWVVVVDQVVDNVVGRAKKLVESVVANLTSSYHKRRQVIRRVRRRHQKALS